MNRFPTLKFIAIGTVVVASVFSFWLWVQQPEITLERDRTYESADRTTEDRTEKEGVQAVLEVPGLSYEVFVPEGSTVYDLMAAAASKYNNFSFKGKEFGGIGFFVEEINGLAQDKGEGRYWIYYINGETAKVGVSQYKIKENDVISWKYEKEH